MPTQEEYTAILQQKELTPEHLITIYDMISADLALLSEIQTERENLTNQVTELRDTNHKLFLRVQSDTTHKTDDTPLTRDEARDKFRDLILKGEL